MATTWMGKSRHAGGLGLGDGPVALVLGLMIVALVGYLTVTGAKRQSSPARPWGGVAEAVSEDPSS
jgi:hypothetical protein